MLTVLVVDDNDARRASLCDTLRTHGVAAQSWGGLCFDPEDPDVLRLRNPWPNCSLHHAIIDKVISGVSAFEVLRQANAEGQFMEAIVISGALTVEDQESATHCSGCNALFHIPGRLTPDSCVTQAILAKVAKWERGGSRDRYSYETLACLTGQMAPSILQGRRFLIIGDEDDVHQLGDRLRSKGACVFWAQDIEEAKSVIADGTLDCLIVTDAAPSEVADELFGSNETACTVIRYPRGSKGSG